MRAAVLTEFGKPLEIEELTDDRLDEGQVRVAVDATGLCHSDLVIASGAIPVPLPTILGHEMAGTVVEIGKGVDAVGLGDRVIGSISPYCGSCPYCTRGLAEHCTATGRPGSPRRRDGSLVPRFIGLGSFADSMVVDQRQVVSVKSELPAEQLALIGCCVVTGAGAALVTTPVGRGDSVAVFGCGAVGQSVVQAAALSGASQIIAIDPNARKREIAEGSGATHFIDPTAGDVIGEVKEITAGLGVDIAFEAVGAPEVVTTAFQAARLGGTVTVLGLPMTDGQVPIPLRGLLGDGKRIVGCRYGSAQVRRDFPRLVSLAECGCLNLGSLITRRVGLDDMNEGFESLEQGQDIRIVAFPSGG